MSPVLVSVFFSQSNTNFSNAWRRGTIEAEIANHDFQRRVALCGAAGNLLPRLLERGEDRRAAIDFLQQGGERDRPAGLLIPGNRSHGGPKLLRIDPEARQRGDPQKAG